MAGAVLDDAEECDFLSGADVRTRRRVELRGNEILAFRRHELGPRQICRTNRRLIARLKFLECCVEQKVGERRSPRARCRGSKWRLGQFRRDDQTVDRFLKNDFWIQPFRGRELPLVDSLVLEEDRKIAARDEFRFSFVRIHPNLPGTASDRSGHAHGSLWSNDGRGHSLCVLTAAAADPVRRTEKDEDSAAVSHRAAVAAIGELIVGDLDARVEFVTKFVSWRVGCRIAPGPEEIDKRLRVRIGVNRFPLLHLHFGHQKLDRAISPIGVSIADLRGRRCGDEHRGK